MVWKKQFKVTPKSEKLRRLTRNTSFDISSNVAATSSKFSSYLPEILAGSPNRLERYSEFDSMDSDSEISSALDIIADFCTQEDESTGLPFMVKYTNRKDVDESEISILDEMLNQWVDVNEFHLRIWRIIRNVIKYGDQIFIRDPETMKWLWSDHNKVESVLVNEAEGRKIESYTIRDLDLNTQALIATKIYKNTSSQPFDYQNPSRIGDSTKVGGYGSPTSYVKSGQNALIAGGDVVDGEHIVHISLSEGLDASWPFGISILETIFKIFKQKELLEDSIIIYRVQRAPERRVFYIDVGNMPPHKAAAYVNRIKNEIHQRRIPNRTGGGTSISDAAYNPLSIVEDYFLATSCISLDTKIQLLDGRHLILQNIINEYNNGKINYVFSQNEKTQAFETGKIVWAGKTRLNTQVLEITLDNEETFKVTPDHLCIKRDGTQIEAQHLKVNDSLMPLYTVDDNSRKYRLHVDNRTGNFVNYSFSFNTNKEFYDICDLSKHNEWCNISFSNKSFINHRIVNISWLEEKQDTGDITIETESGSHIFALSAGVYIHNSDGRTSKIETLQGGNNLGDITDLLYFDNKLKRGLGVPSSYLPTGPEDGSAQFNDGKVTTAYMQEYRFNKYCERLQRIIVRKFDHEFKLFLKSRGITIHSSKFKLHFTPPQNFAKFRQYELDSQRITSFIQLSDTKYISKRFMLSRYLGLSESEISENEALWLEENPNPEESSESENHSETPSLASVGIVGSDSDEMINNDEIGERPFSDQPTEGQQSPISGNEGEPPVTTTGEEV